MTQTVPDKLFMNSLITPDNLSHKLSILSYITYTTPYYHSPYVNKSLRLKLQNIDTLSFNSFIEVINKLQYLRSLEYIKSDVNDQEKCEIQLLHYTFLDTKKMPNLLSTLLMNKNLSSLLSALQITKIELNSILNGDKPLMLFHVIQIIHFLGIALEYHPSFMNPNTIQ